MITNQAASVKPISARTQQSLLPTNAPIKSTTPTSDLLQTKSSLLPPKDKEDESTKKAPLEKEEPRKIQLKEESSEEPEIDQGETLKKEPQEILEKDLKELSKEKQEQTVSKNDVVEKAKNDRSESAKPLLGSPTKTRRALSPTRNTGPRYARPKKSIERRPTTPSRPRTPLLRSPKKISPSSSKAPRPSRSKSPNRRREDKNTAKKRIILSPKSQQRSERKNRPSFQGLTVIDGKRKNKSQTKNEDTQIAERKAERRRKSLNFMSKSAQSDQIREMLENTMDNCLDAFVIEGTAEERLQSVMTKAKQSGMTTESIFSFFNGGNPNTTHITKETFLVALEKLGDTFVIISDEELTGIVEKFDHNKDGQVSIDEFKNYCYEISSVPWKAERMRLERSGELKNLRAQLSRRFTLSDVEDGHSCGEEVYRTSKLFWKTNNNVEIRFFYSTDLNVITVQLYSQTFEEELASIYICRNKIEYQITSLEDEITKALRAGDSPSDDMEEVKRQTTWEVISKYIVARLKLKSHSEIAEDEVPELECAHIPNEASYIPFLCKLTGDTFDTLMIQKPFNLSPPPPISSGAIGDFHQRIASFRKETRKARASRMSAEGLTDLVQSALSEVDIC